MLKMTAPLMATALLAAVVSPAKAAHFSLIHQFDNTNGANPIGGLTMDASGNLYGTTSTSATGQGVVFELAPPGLGSTHWHETRIGFEGLGSKAPVSPRDGVVFDAAGALYGTSYQGGSHGFGTVYRLQSPSGGSSKWTATVLHSFADGNDGSYPQSRPLVAADGTLYGVASAGGSGNCGTLSGTSSTGCGTVFMLTPPVSPDTTWTFKVIHQFRGGDEGAIPMGALIADSSGVLYGTTFKGGNSDNGMVFSLTPPPEGQTAWHFRILRRFNGKNGSNPVGNLARDTAGNLYGVTQNGGAAGIGIVYKLSPPASPGKGWTETSLLTFPTGVSGAYPAGGLVENTSGDIFGVTAHGGEVPDIYGVAFAIEPGQDEIFLHSFSSYGDGANPTGTLFLDTNGDLYGTAKFGGNTTNCSGGCGTIYKIKLP